MSSAWLIRRFIDANARFAFAARDAEPPDDQVAFDTFTGEFTHQGKLCTFEVLLGRFGLDRPSLTHVAEIVHDIDLKEQRYQRAETPTVAALVEGIRQSTAATARRSRAGWPFSTPFFNVRDRRAEKLNAAGADVPAGDRPGWGLH